MGFRFKHDMHAYSYIWPFLKNLWKSRKGRSQSDMLWPRLWSYLISWLIHGKWRGTHIPRILNGGEVVPASPCNAHSTFSSVYVSPRWGMRDIRNEIPSRHLYQSLPIYHQFSASIIRGNVRSHNIINICSTLQHFPTIEIIIHPAFYCS